MKNFTKTALFFLAGIMPLCVSAQTACTPAAGPVPGKDGDRYVPYGERTGNESIVYFTRNMSPEGLVEAYEQVCADISGKVGVKLHTG